METCHRDNNKVVLFYISVFMMEFFDVVGIFSWQVLSFNSLLDHENNIKLDIEWFPWDQQTLLL
jgi:hypothetical protein